MPKYDCLGWEQIVPGTQTWQTVGSRSEPRNVKNVKIPNPKNHLARSPWRSHFGARTQPKTIDQEQWPSQKITYSKLSLRPSRGGLEVEAWTDNCLHSASVGSNPV